MTFISISFLLVFLPLSALLVATVGRLGAPSVTGVVLLAISTAFYASFGWRALCVLLASAMTNFVVADLISRSSRGQIPLYLGIMANLVLLGIFKYGIASAFSTSAVPYSPIEIVGISYFTFQQISYLFQIHAKRAELLSILDYFQFVIFFPTLVSGPIPRSSELAPQLKKARRVTSLNLQVGMTLICIGIAKKVLVADPLGMKVDTVFDLNSSVLTPLNAWIAALAFTFQVYFDFSGYTDIAIGCARVFGIILPINFLSPLRAASIQDFWRRWHMTMTRFFSDFVYTPLAVSLTRIAIARRLGPQSQFLIAVAAPTILTFVLVGLWHDAGINFLLFGFLHGLALAGYQWWAGRKKRSRSPQTFGPPATLLFVIVTLVLFRAQNFETARIFWMAMAGFAPEGSLGAAASMFIDHGFLATLLAATIVTMYCPSSYEFMASYTPGLKGPVPINPTPFSGLSWQPNPFWSIFFGLLGGLSFMLALRSELANFVYVRF